MVMRSIFDSWPIGYLERVRDDGVVNISLFPRLMYTKEQVHMVIKDLQRQRPYRKYILVASSANPSEFLRGELPRHEAIQRVWAFCRTFELHFHIEDFLL